MLYRPFGQTGEEVSILGFGCMRLPVLEGRHDRIDVPEATRMLRYAIDEGVNYVDTAYPYHGTSHREPGSSEVFVGEALGDGYREKVLLATKLPSWLVQSRRDMDRFLDDQLDRLQTSHIDCYLLHSLHADSWHNLDRLNVLDFLEAAKEDGRIRYAGFSYHGTPESFAPIVDAYNWDFCQIQYNYMDIDYQAGLAGLRYAADRGIGVVVMEPLKGGRLAARIPEGVEKTLRQTGPADRTPAAWALRYVWDDPGVSLLLSGMTAMEHVEENVRVADHGHANSLTEAERSTIEQARQEYRSRVRADCTECRYCLPCPSGVDIPWVMQHINDLALYDDLKGALMAYGMRSEGTASDCSQCGECEEVCPQGLPIRQLMEEAARVFENNPGGTPG